MICNKNIIKKLKRKFREFKKNERGGEIIEKLLYLALALLIISALLLWAVQNFEELQKLVEDIFNFKF